MLPTSKLLGYFSPLNSARAAISYQSAQAGVAHKAEGWRIKIDLLP